MDVVSLPSLEMLREYVHEVLCEHDRLDREQTPMFQGLITRKGRNCGLFFQVHGPRLLKTYALWSADEDRILFYDATGIRFGETRLSEGPDPDRLAA